MLTSFLPGFALSLTLILAIGAQNAFVLRQGLRREHVFWVCLTCGVTDALLIIAGVAGFGALSTALPWFETLMRYGGAAFLLWYGFLNARSAWRGGEALEVASLSRYGRADRVDFCAISRLACVRGRGHIGQHRVFLCAGLWRAVAQPAVRQAGQLAHP